jgi:acyl-coenzyme A thioesterase PaaI-like protein
MVPYSSTIRASVEFLEPGYARLRLRDRRRVRNHLGSVHAVALTNLGELASGLALVTSVPPDVRSIVTRLETRFHHKARGNLVAACRTAPEVIEADTERKVQATIHDTAGVLVAEVWATWRLSPPPTVPMEDA